MRAAVFAHEVGKCPGDYDVTKVKRKYFKKEGMFNHVEVH